MPISYKNMAKMLRANRRLTKQAKIKALKTYKRRYKKVQRKI